MKARALEASCPGTEAKRAEWADQGAIAPQKGASAG